MHDQPDRTEHRSRERTRCRLCSGEKSRVDRYGSKVENLFDFKTGPARQWIRPCIQNSAKGCFAPPDYKAPATWVCIQCPFHQAEVLRLPIPSRKFFSGNVLRIVKQKRLIVEFQFDQFLVMQGNGNNADIDLARFQLFPDLLRCFFPHDDVQFRKLQRKLLKEERQQEGATVGITDRLMSPATLSLYLPGYFEQLIDIL